VQLCFFGLQNVARLYVEQIGSDIAPAIDACEQTARERGSAVMQVYLPLDRPSAPAATEILRRNGYFLGGMLPRWFDGDGLMMQKLHSEPHFDTIRLYSPRAQKLSAFIRNDRARAEKQS
jgi:hypothetical protein